MRFDERPHGLGFLEGIWCRSRSPRDACLPLVVVFCFEGCESGLACLVGLPLIGQVPIEPEAEPSEEPGGYLLRECVHTQTALDKVFPALGVG
jgi:hypothetical protein